MKLSARFRGIQTSTMVLLVILILFSMYAGIFIYKSSFMIVAEDTRYFTLFDDAMISMQYAKNLANGDGLVWNAGGERVEGFSNPLWVFMMAAIHLLPLPASKMSLAVQILGAVLLLLNLIFVKLAGDEISDKNIFVSIGAVLLTALYYPLNNWALLGNEVSLLALLITITIWLVFRGFRQGNVSRWIYPLMAIGLFVRMDALIPFTVILLFLIIFDSAHRMTHIKWGLGFIVGALLLQLFLRYAYFGEVLPNTYYLKMTGISLISRITRGSYVFFKFIWNFNWILFLLPFIICLIIRDPRSNLLMSVIAAQMLYSIYIGGDAWEHRGGSNRFIAIVMPLFFILFTYSLERLRQSLLAYSDMTGSRLTRAFSWIALSSVVLFGVINFNSLLDTGSLKYLFLKGVPLFVEGNERNTTIGLYVKEITDENAKVAVVVAGAIPYYSNRYSIDLLGKNDKLIARSEMKPTGGTSPLDFRPGHSKWDYAHSIGDLKPDVIVELWAGTSKEAEPYMEDYVVIEVGALSHFLHKGRLYLRKGSEHIQWERADVIPVDS